MVMESGNECWLFKVGLLFTRYFTISMKHVSQMWVTSWLVLSLGGPFPLILRSIAHKEIQKQAPACNRLPCESVKKICGALNTWIELAKHCQQQDLGAKWESCQISVCPRQNYLFSKFEEFLNFWDPSLPNEAEIARVALGL